MVPVMSISTLVSSANWTIDAEPGTLYNIEPLAVSLARVMSVLGVSVCCENEILARVEQVERIATMATSSARHLLNKRFCMTLPGGFLRKHCL